MTGCITHDMSSVQRSSQYYWRRCLECKSRLCEDEEKICWLGRRGDMIWRLVDRTRQSRQRCGDRRRHSAGQTSPDPKHHSIGLSTSASTKFINFKHLYAVVQNFTTGPCGASVVISSS